jgi:hypothetical protein
VAAAVGRQTGALLLLLLLTLMIMILRMMMTTALTATQVRERVWLV